MSRSGTTLLGWSISFLAMDVVHDLDHIRRSNYSPNPVKVLGFLALAGAVITVGLAAKRHRYANVFAAVFGFTAAIGFVAVHVVPEWSVFSDPFPALHVDALSWFIAALDILVALGLGMTGLRGMQKRPVSVAS